MQPPINKIICGDCLEVLPKLPKAKMIFADPPDNLGVRYNAFVDKIPHSEYINWIATIGKLAIEKCEIYWISYHAKYTGLYAYSTDELNCRRFIWRFTFGQHRQSDCGYGYRPIMRLMQPNAEIYPDAIRVPSARQTKYNDKRANPKGRVPDDVWEFPRVCGTFKEKRKWAVNQHPEALIERVVKFSCKPDDLVIDMFAHSGTVNRVCQRLGISCIGIEISKFYCEQIARELKIPLEVAK